MEKYLVSFRFQYSEIPEYEDDSTSRDRTLTIGVFDNLKEACLAGNACLEIMEKHFPLNPHYNLKQRFSEGNKIGARLISDITYISTPFTFYASIKTLKHGDFEDYLLNVTRASNEYREWQKEQREED